MGKNTILNLYTSYRFKSIEQILTELEGEIDKSAISIDDFNWSNTSPNTNRKTLVTKYWTNLKPELIGSCIQLWKIHILCVKIT